MSGCRRFEMMEEKEMVREVNTPRVPEPELKPGDRVVRVECDHKTGNQVRVLRGKLMARYNSFSNTMADLAENNAAGYYPNLHWVRFDDKYLGTRWHTFLPHGIISEKLYDEGYYNKLGE